MGICLNERSNESVSSANCLCQEFREELNIDVPGNCLPAGTDWEDSGCSTGNSAQYLQEAHKHSEHS